MTTDETIFHIAMPDDWDAARRAGEYTMSSRGRHLDDEGFIHASTRAQTEATANRFYADVDELVLLTIDPSRTGVELRWEPPTPGVDELFPHLYGPLPVAAVRAHHTWRRRPDGWSTDDLPPAAR
jgi:glutathione S-transferase